jgi:CubicO group peptidase (beta-lactamase class C family)
MQIYGEVKPGFEAVRDEFERNFRERGELGAACAVYHRGEKIVDLWGGLRDEKTGAPWQEDTLIVVFSTTKGVASMAVAVAHSRGLFDYDDPVTKYWPEFAQNGKEAVTIRQLLNHQAGLPAIDEPLDLAILGDPDRTAAIIARQKPAWEPGTHHGYHGISLGWYESELIRRFDPQGRTIGQYFRDEVAEPLGLEFYIGLPSDVPRERLATIKGYKRWQLLFNLDKMPRPFVFAILNPRSLTARTFGNPAILEEINGYNERHMLEIELPAANGVGQVRSIARAYSEFATGDETLGLSEKTLDELKSPVKPPSEGLKDQVLRIETAFSLGYLKPFPGFRFGTDEQSFGTPGAGGSFAFADPVAEIGFAYAMNRSGFYLWNDPREEALREAVYRAL